MVYHFHRSGIHGERWLQRRVLVSFPVTLALVLTAIPTAAAEQPVRLFLGSEELKTDVPPQIIDGRTMGDRWLIMGTT